MRMTIQGQDYDFEEKDIPIERLRFWSENPRIRSGIYGLYTDEAIEKISSEELQKKISEELEKKGNIQDMYRKLTSHEGIVEHLFVRKVKNQDTYEVLEGNRRLAASKMAIKRAMSFPESSRNKSIIERFSKIRCAVTPESMSESAIFSLIGTWHLGGKDPWTPFDKARSIKNRESILRKELSNRNENFDTNSIRQKIANELGDTLLQIKIQIDNIEMMEEIQETNKEKYSHYDVLNRNKKCRKSMENEENRMKWLETAKKRPDKETALAFRRMVKNVCDDDGLLADFLNGKKTFEDAAEISEYKGKADDIYERINKFKSFITSNEEEILSIDSSEGILKNIITEFDELQKFIKKIQCQLNENDN